MELEKTFIQRGLSAFALAAGLGKVHPPVAIVFDETERVVSMPRPEQQLEMRRWWVKRACHSSTVAWEATGLFCLPQQQ